MDLPHNLFKKRLAEGGCQLGLWHTLGGAAAAEILALAGFDWVLVDTEHSPAEITDAMGALQALAAYPQVGALVRPAINEVMLIKRHLDQGALTLLIPFVQTVGEAEAAVRAIQYPPRGVRGIGGTTRASRYGHAEGYAARAADELCLIVQVETIEALGRLEAIAGVEGVDAVFFGPNDISASMGLPGQTSHPKVKAAVLDGIARMQALGKPSGLLTLDRDFARECMAAGASFICVGVDIPLLVDALKGLRADF